MSALPRARSEGFTSVLGPGKRVCISALRREDGQALTEYALVILLIVLVSVPALELIGVSVAGYIVDTATQI